MAKKQTFGLWKRRLWRVAKYSAIAIIVLVCVSRFIIPAPVFEDPKATVLLDVNGELLGARIAPDGQWRFPESDNLPSKFEHCILTFEDRHFNSHLGVNPVSLFRALKVNIKAGRIKQGGSTITMQLARIWQKGKPRTVVQKLKEMLIAFHFEINYSKDEILALYASHAPFGGNVVGLEAASWRYFGRAPDQLTWSEMAALAVLPNAPSLIFPGKNEELLRKKRNRLLSSLTELGFITEQELQLARIEPLPGKPKRLPSSAQHLLDRAAFNRQGEKTTTGIVSVLQRRAQEIVNSFGEVYSHNDVNNAAAVILSTETAQVLAYVGNTTNSDQHGNAVDVVKARRSTGSLLKPFLYASTLSKGEILPKKLLTDIPTFISGYAPENYNKTFDGVVPANEALYRSLNVPFVRLLREHGVKRFYDELKLMKMSSLDYGSGRYGLSLVLGGAEGELMDLTSMYAGLGRVLLNYDGEGDELEGSFFTSSGLGLPYEIKDSDQPNLKASAVYETLNALTEAKRPDGEQGWKYFGSSRKVAWKTGTSFGHRDAWAIGTTPEYTIGVWVGNGDGEGRAGLTGLGYAAPVLFNLFDELPSTSWFDKPYDDYKEALVCRASGHLAGNHCHAADTVLIPNVESKLAPCNYHQWHHLDQSESYRVNANCESPEQMVHKSWFVLTPAQEWYFRMKSPTYQSLPPIRSDCIGTETQVMEFIYPKFPNKIYIPKYLNGEEGTAVFDLAHRTASQKVFWYLDQEYIGYTLDFHQKEITTTKGEHVLLVTDEQGNELVKKFECLSK